MKKRNSIKKVRATIWQWDRSRRHIMSTRKWN